MCDAEPSPRSWFERLVGLVADRYTLRTRAENTQMRKTVSALRHERNKGIWAIRIERNKHLADVVVAAKFKALNDENEALTAELARVRKEAESHRAEFERARSRLNAEVTKLTDMLMHCESKP